jgi:hypothetical protein
MKKPVAFTVWMVAIICMIGLSACDSGGSSAADAAAGAGPDAPPGTPDGAVGGVPDATTDPTPDATPLDPPPATWQEHWFEHDQLLQLVDYNDTVAMYFDPDVNRSGTEWILPFMTSLWQYTKATYGDLGPDRLYIVFHENKYSGGHPSTYFDDSHDFRNVTDCGPGPWQSGYDIPSHEAGHIVESALHGVHGSPAFALWGDSKWMEFYQYDAYVALDMPAEAQRLFDKFTATSDDFPRAGTHWFRDWFYPLWRDHGHAQVMVKYFQLEAQYFPRNGHDYARDMSFGEFVHFMSGAAGTNLKALATTAFGWPADREAEFLKARTDFPQITY